MAKLRGNIGDLVKNAAQSDKRKQLIPEKKTTTKKAIKPGPEALKTSSEDYIRTHLELPESLKHDIDLFFVQTKRKGKNEFMVEAIRKHLERIKR